MLLQSLLLSLLGQPDCRLARSLGGPAPIVVVVVATGLSLEAESSGGGGGGGCGGEGDGGQAQQHEAKGHRERDGKVRYIHMFAFGAQNPQGMSISI